MSDLVPDTSHPTLSVVLIVLNGASWIDRQLDALADQRGAPDSWELVVADNGSTDGTQGMVRARADSFPVPLRVVDASAMVGASHARNVGASAANARLLAFCDCDDVVDDGWVAAAVQALEDHVCVGGTNRALEEPHNPDSEVLNPGGLHGRGIQSCNFAVRRDVFFEVGGFDESLPPYGCEDSEFSIRVLKRGHRITPAPAMVLYFRRTVGFRRTLGKVYMSGIAETVVWLRHPDAFAQELSLRSVVVDLVSWPGRALRQRRAGQLSARRLARSAVTAWAHVVGYLTWIRTNRAGSARLVFEPYDVD